MKKIVLALVLLIGISQSSFGATADNRVTGGTVAFRTRGVTITFNTVTRRLWFMNESTTDDCYINIRCEDADQYVSYDAKYHTVKIPAVGKITPSTVSLDFSTKKLNFISNGGSGGNLYYVLTTDKGEF